MSKINITIVFLIISLQLSAQRPQTEFQIVGSAGIIPISLQSGVSTSGFEGNAGVGITAFVSRNIGIHLGFGIGTMRREITVDHLQTVIYGLIDVNNYIFDLHSTLSGYTETLRTSHFFSIPLMLQFQPNTQGFYAMGGAKIHFSPLTGLSPTRGFATLNNAGYFPELGNWATAQAFAGFGTFDGNRNFTTLGSTYSSDLYTVLAFEVGWKWRIGDNTFLYTGAFINYSLDDPLRGHRHSLDNRLYDIFTHDDFNHFSFTGLERFLNVPPLLDYVNRVNSITVGLRLRLAFTRSDTPRASPRSRALPCPPGQMRHNRSWDRPSPIFNLPSGR